MRIEKVSLEDRQLEKIEKEIEYLTEELAETRKQIQRDKSRRKLRKLREREHQIKHVLENYHYQARCISESYFDDRRG